MKYGNTNSRQLVLMLIIGLMLTRVWSANLNKDTVKEKSSFDLSKKNFDKPDSNNKQNNFVNPQIVDALPKKTVVNTITKVSNFDLAPTQICGCASLVKCAPCGVVLFKEEIVDCACAPKPKCPVCPPLSLIHEMAAKRAKQDQKLVNSLRGYTNRMNILLDGINRYSNDIVQFEMKAKEMAQKMEAAGLKAQVARKNMYKMSENAKQIAKMTLSPCYGVACPSFDPSYNPPYADTKIFPQEVENVKDYLKEATISSNI